jgi:hypothetical protein
MVTTPIAQTSDLLVPISKSATRTKPTCTNESVRGISLVWRVQKQMQSAVKLGSVRKAECIRAYPLSDEEITALAHYLTRL